MRNLRKLTAAVLAIAIVLTSMTAVFAADTTTTSTVVNGDKAVTLKDLGLYAGQDPNDPKIGLEDALTTQDSLIFLAKLFGYFDAANKLTADEVAEALAKFDDADSISDYAKNVVAYSAANGILSGSTSNGKFFVGAKDTVTAARFATFMLKQMGYTVPKYTQSVAQIAAIDGSKVSATLAGDLIRDDAVGAMYGVLPAKKANGTTVIADIVGTDAALKAIAEKAGLIAVEGLVKSVSAVTTTKVLVTLNKAVDSAAAANFAIAGATVSAAALSNGTDVVLTTSVLTPTKEYSLTVSGLKSNAVENASVTKTFVVPDISKLYAPTLTSEKTVLKADGASSTLVTFSLKDNNNKVIEDAQDVEVAFTTTFGNFGEKRVSVQKGVATVMFTSEFLNADKTAELTALVVEAKDTNLIGLKANASIILSPNPDSITETLGATLVSAESNQADRITLYFNKEVNVANYVFPSTNALKGQVDTTKALIAVKKGTLDDGTLGTPVNYKGLLPVDGNKKALQLLLDVEANTNNALTDNANVTIGFNDLTGTVAIPVVKTFKLTDARKPAMLSVSNDGSLRKLKVIFSEPVEYTSALTSSNWSIDGTLLSNATAWGAATVTVGAFDVANATDNRSVVTITLGAGKYFTTGAHSIQAANIGDWAKLSDPFNNVMNTQTLDYTIDPDTSAPVATVEVQSPEQWLVTYNRDVAETAADFQAKLNLQRLDAATGTWLNDTLPLSVIKIDDNKFLVETRVDWTIANNTLGTLKNYFNFSYQLKIAKDAVTNVANGLKSAEQSLALGGAMLTPDTTSPVISTIEEVTAGTAYKATMSEPVKMLINDLYEGLTPAQTQASIPVVTASFIKSDFTKTVEGTVGNAFLDSYDKVLDVKPASTLEAGNWILVIRSISDDIGNTAASVTKEFTVAGTVTNTAFKVLWSFADVDTDLDAVNTTDLTGDQDTSYDYVYVKFNKAVSISGDFKNALKTANYTLDGSALPLGTQILANIAGYDELDAVVDSVTIRLPQGYLSGKNSPHVVNVSTNLESVAGEKITSAGELLLPYAVTTVDWLQFAADLTIRRVNIDTVIASAAACESTVTPGAIDVSKIAAFQGACTAAKTELDKVVVATGATSYVNAQYVAAINSWKAKVAALTGFTNTLTGNVGASTSQLVFTVGNGASAGFTATTSNLYVATVSDTGLVTVEYTGATPMTAVITVTDSFWNVTKQVTVTVANGVVTAIA